MSIKTRLISKIGTHKATVGIIGLGYVGLPLVIRFGEAGFKVTGLDVDEDKINKLNQGQSYIKHIPSAKLKELIKSEKFQATSDFSCIKDIDCLIICVPTPLSDNKEPDISYIEATADDVAKYIREGQLISLESTTYPGTTREVLLPRFEQKGLKAGEDFFLAFSPEREDPGNPKFNTKNIPKVVGGITPACTEAADVLYGEIIDKTVPVSSTEVAEFTKLLENIFRSVNIALVNELKILASRMGIDIWEVIEAASTKPFGFKAFYPGPGLGGHCIPIDPFYLSWKARGLDFDAHFIEYAGQVNTNMPQYVISKTADALNSRGKCFKDARILVLGIAYKKDSDDVRESPALKLLEILKSKGAEVYYNDPYVPRIPEVRKYDFNLISSPLTKGLLKRMDAVMIVTDHSRYDYAWIVKNSDLIIDTRNATQNVNINRHKIIRA